METDYNQIEGRPTPSPPIPIPSAPPANRVYYVHPPVPSRILINDPSEDISIYIPDNYPQHIEEDPVDYLVIYVCAVIAFFIPIFGLLYICCFRFCCGSGSYPFQPRKRKAFKILVLMTMIGIAIDIIFGSLISNGNIKLNN